MDTRLAQQIVAEFWERVGFEEPFPRQLERSIMSTKPVHVIKLYRQRLDTVYIRTRFLRRGVHLPATFTERKLNGCLVANRGEAAIFVDGTLSADDVRVVIAHEFGHYLADYELPRLRAMRGLGDGILDVLDGVRPPAKSELLAATLAQVHVGFYVHYMDRAEGAGMSSLVTEVEDTANVVAAELLAPQRTVVAEIARASQERSQETILRILESRFGLPTSFAHWYAGRLVECFRRRESFCDVLGFGTRRTMES